MPDLKDRPTPATSFLASLLPSTWIGRALLGAVIVWFINWTFSDGEQLFGSAALKTLADLLSALGLIPLAISAARAARWFVRGQLWRLRQRLIFTYFLIGVLPLVLVLALAGLVGFAVIMQSSSTLVARQLDGYLEQSRAAALAISRDLARTDLATASPEQLRRQLAARVDALEPIFPAVTLAVRREAGPVIAAGAGAAARELRLPPWFGARAEFHGLTVEENGAGRRLVGARHVLQLARPAGTIFELSYPISNELSDHLSQATGLTVKPGQAILPLTRTAAGEPMIDNAQIERQAGRIEPTLSGFPIIVPITDWGTGASLESEALLVDPAFLLPGQIWRRLVQFRSGSVLGSYLTTFIGGLAGFFLLITLIAFVSAAFLTRSITGAVHCLYEGTKRIEAGNLDHEIPTRSRDQLGALARSFNQMTRSVRELLRVSAEKERLDQEMRIAAEVQARLFPPSTPQSAALDIAPGVCIPARLVSGDYFDFLPVAPGVIGVVVADVCGKGVSAALMMANLQANLRSQIDASRDAHDERLRLAAQVDSSLSSGVAPDLHRARRIVARVNRQLAASMPEASYVTLFYAEFDEAAGTVRYTNAGHNPPLLLRRGADATSIEQLGRGGTVLGLFREVEYEDVELKLERGDLLAIFTDGLIEARDPQGREFGEERLSLLLEAHAQLASTEISARILGAVRDWTAGAEQEDDLTLVIIKKR